MNADRVAAEVLFRWEGNRRGFRHRLYELRGLGHGDELSAYAPSSSTTPFTFSSHDKVSGRKSVINELTRSVDFQFSIGR